MAEKSTDTKLIFVETLEKSPEERRAYLDRVCGTNTELRQRVEEWLLPSALALLPMGLVALQPDLGEIAVLIPVDPGRALGRALAILKWNCSANSARRGGNEGRTAPAQHE